MDKEALNDILFYTTMGALIITCLYITSAKILPENIDSLITLSIPTSIAVFTLIITKHALDETKKSVKLSQETLMKAENEQQIRDIEKSFDYFCYPLRDYLDPWITPYPDSNFRPPNILTQKMEWFAHYRYLATDITREYFEKVYRPDSYMEWDNAAQLLKHVNDEINEKTIKLNNLKNQTK